MSRQEPTREEQEYIDARHAYEEACLGWSPAQPWPHAPKVIKLGWRPSFPSDDPKVYEAMLRSYVAAGHNHRGTAPFPVRPKPHPGRLPRIDSTTGEPAPTGRPRLFARGQRVVLQLVVDMPTAEALDAEARTRKQSRSELLRHLIEKGLTP